MKTSQPTSQAYLGDRVGLAGVRQRPFEGNTAACIAWFLPATRAVTCFLFSPFPLLLLYRGSCAVSSPAPDWNWGWFCSAAVPNALVLLNGRKINVQGLYRE